MSMARPWLDVMEIAADPMRFGAPLGLKGQRRDLSADWTLLLQAGIDRLVGHPNGTVMDETRGTLYLPPGIYRITSPLLIRRIDVSDMGPAFARCTVEIMGDTPGPAFGPGNTLRQVGATHASVIYADFRDRPAIIIQFGRSVRLRNLAIQGHNDWISVPGRDPRDMAVHADDANYYDRRPHSVPLRWRIPLPDPWGPVEEAPPRDTRHSPYAGVCIDPFLPAVPTEERYPGMDKDRLYSLPGTGSTLLTIEGCHIRGFVTGIVISPGLLANAENILIADTTIESTVSAVAICQDQSRHVVLRDVNILGAKYAVNCVEYGQGNGCFAPIFGVHIAGVRHLFHAFCHGSAYAIKGLVAESFWGIGQLDGNPNFDGYVFDGCRFTFGRLPASVEAVSAHLLNYTNAVFNECDFAFAPGEPQDPGPIQLYNASQATLSLNGCVFRTDVPEDPEGKRTRAPLWVSEFQEGACYHGCILQAPEQLYALSSSYPPTMPQFANQVRPPLLAPPGSLYSRNTFYPVLPPLGNQDADFTPLAPVSSLHWVSGVYPRIWLGDVTLREGYEPARSLSYELDLEAIASVQDPNIQRAFRELGAAPILRPGDLILADVTLDELEITLPIHDNLRAGRTGRIILGRLDRVLGLPLGMPPQRIFLAQVPAAVWQAYRKLQAMGKPMTARLYASYFPKIHPPTWGTVQHGSDLINSTVRDTIAEGMRSERFEPGGTAKGQMLTAC
jgi:hypothetical protein